MGQGGAHRRVKRYLTPIAIALTFGSGAMDVASFTRLGGVFSSVMTGNIVLCGLSIAHGSVSLMLHTLTAVAGYVCGVAGGSRIGWWHSVRNGSSSEPAAASGAAGSDAAGSGGAGDGWAPHVRAVLVGELVLLCGLLIGWEVSGSAPTGLGQFALLAVAAAAMGMQSAAVGQMGLTQVSTTFLTGTLTGLVGSLARPDRQRVGVVRPGVLVGLLAGALLCGLLIYFAAWLVPVVLVGSVALVVLLQAS